MPRRPSNQRSEKEFGSERIRHFMREQKINTADLARRSGVQASVISRILSENRDFKFSTAMKLAKGLRVSLDVLAGRPAFHDTQLERARRLSAQLEDVLWRES